MKIVLKLSLPARRYRYRGQRKMLKTLGPVFASPTKWSAVHSEPDGAIAAAFDRTPGGHKSAHYFSIYESAVDRTRPLRMLQIGSFYEDSLQVWREHLHRDSLIVGIDMNSQLLKIADSQGVHVRFGAAHDLSFLREVAAEFGPFDIVLDHGSHTSSHMVDSFRCLFANAMNDNGVYIVEDVDCDYQTVYRDSRVSFIDFVRALIDAMHSPYQVATSDTSLQVGHPDRMREISVPAITPLLGSVEAYDSLIVVRRANRDVTQRICRP